MSNNKQSSVDLFYQAIKMHLTPNQIMHLEQIYPKAKAMQQEQAQLYANYVVVSIEQGLPPITFNDWINLHNNEQQ
jgi:hypothetical protein